MAGARILVRHRVRGRASRLKDTTKSRQLLSRMYHLEQLSHCTQMEPSCSATSNLAPDPSPRPLLAPRSPRPPTTPPPSLGAAPELPPPPWTPSPNPAAGCAAAASPPLPALCPGAAWTGSAEVCAGSPAIRALTVTTRVGYRQLASHACGGGRTAGTLVFTPRRMGLYFGMRC